MGAVGYTSSISERDYYQAEQGREATEIAEMPGAERQEVRDIYAAKGFSGTLLDDVVDTITANRDTWLATMMDEELHLQPKDSGRRPESIDVDRWFPTDVPADLSRLRDVIAGSDVEEDLRPILACLRLLRLHHLGVANIRSIAGS